MEETNEPCSADLRSVANYPSREIAVGPHVLCISAQKELSPFDALLLLDDQDLTGHKLWEGARLLLNYLHLNAHLVSSRRVLELGCGCGVVGVFASMLGARRVVVTDGNASLKSLVETNIAANGAHACTFSVLEWSVDGSSPGPVDGELFDVVLAADVIYDPDVVVPLLHTAKRSLAPSGVFILAFVRRCMGDVQALIRQTAEQLSFRTHTHSCADVIASERWAKDLDATDTLIYEFSLEG